MTMKFIGRQSELDYLKQVWDQPTAALIILYGRRRVGKTELLRVFAEERKSIFYVGTQSSSAEQLRTFTDAVRRGLGEVAEGVGFGDWDGALRYLAARTRSERILVVLDEFPYLSEASPDLPSLLQRAWDQELRNGQIVLVLCGSSVSVMQSELLAHHSPLYGRRSGQYLVEPFGYQEAGQFFPAASAEEKVELYATLGGMPAYLLQFRPQDSLWVNIRRAILSKGAFLREEVPFLLMQELREPRLYQALLTAMAEGRTRLGDIAERALGPGQSSKAGFYLQTLQDLRLVERRIPITETAPHKSRKGIYVLSDPFVRFWMRFVFEETSVLEAGRGDELIAERIQPAWSDFVAPVFEEICRQYVRHTMPFTHVGSWWSARGEIDVVGLDRHRTKLFCAECKWSTRPLGTNVLDDLTARARLLAEETEIHHVELAVFSRRGFTAALEERARQEGVRLFTAADLYRDS